MNVLSRAGMWPLDRAVNAAGVVVAIAAVALVLVPASYWNRPSVDDTYTGFDSNLVHADPRGVGSKPGIVMMTSESLRLQALASSDPTVDLATSPRSFSVAMQMTILEAQGAGVPLQLCLSNSVTSYRACLVFGPSPSNSIAIRTIAPDGSTIQESVLGSYSPGLLYSLTASVDRSAGLFHGEVTSDELPPFSGNMLGLGGGRNSPQTYGDVVSDPLPVKPGVSYTFGGLVKVVAGSDTYKLNALWLDRHKNPLNLTNDWHSVGGLFGWSKQQITGTAPPNAAFAQVHLAAGDATRVLFAQLFFREGALGPNQLPNPNFTSSSAGWRVMDEPQRHLDILTPTFERVPFAVRSSDVPQLFAYIRNYLELSSPSDGGTSTAVIQDYTLTLPAQRWFAVRVADARATDITIVLGAAGLVLFALRLALWIRQRSTAVPKRWPFGPGGPILIRPWVIVALVGGLAYLVANSFLFSLGEMPFDMWSQQVWSYISAAYGMPEIYFRPFIATTLAPLSNGHPLNEPGYPYGITTAYLYAFIGWFYKSAFAGPGDVNAISTALAFLIKSSSVLFAAGDGATIFLILRRVDERAWPAAIAATLFLLNPAVIFGMSIWGQIETIAIFPILISIYFAESNRFFLAWLALAAAAFSKPQVMVIVPLLAIVYLRRFPFGTNAVAAAWAAVVSFLFLVPFALAISPSLPVDIASSIVGVWGSAVDPSQNSVAGDSYSLWPLITRIAAGQSQLERFYYPNTAQLINGMSYNTVSNLLLGGLFGAVTTVLLLFRRASSSLESYAPYIALAIFGFMMFKTGMLSRYFIYCIPLLILTKRSMSGPSFYTMIAVATITTFIGIVGGFGVETTATPWVAPLFHQGHGLAESGVSLFLSDWFITLAVTGNLCILAFLTVAAAGRLTARPDRIRSVSHATQETLAREQLAG